MTVPATAEGGVRDPLREGLLVGPLDDLSQVRLAGCKCSFCGEVSLGEARVCPNCGKDQVKTVALNDQGVLWSFTVIRHAPPGDYRGPKPFAPFGMGLVELPEGLRVLSPIQCDIDDLKIGMPLRFRAYVRNDPDRDVVTFTFEPAEAPGV